MKTSKAKYIVNTISLLFIILFPLSRAAAQSQAPYGGSARNIPGVIQAEDFDNGGEGVAYHDITAENEGGEYRTSEGVDISTSASENSPKVGWFKNGEWMEYTVNVTAGIYNIHIRVATTDDDRQLKVYLDGIPLATLYVPNTGSYDDWQTYTVSNISLNGGNGKILRLENVNGDFDFNWIEFERVSGPPAQAPYGGTARTLPGIIQSEDFDIGGEGVSYHDVTTENEGGQYRPSEGVDIGSGDDGSSTVGWFSNGEWMEYTVNVTAGIYNIHIRVATTEDNRQLKVSLDGTLLATLNIPNTGSYDDWLTYTVNNISLTGGNGKILRLENVNSDFDFNWIEFERVSGPLTQAPYGGTARTLPGIIQAEDFDTGGEGVAYHDITTENEGGQYRTSEGVDISAGDAGSPIIGWFKNGEWMEYTVNVETGTYDISIRVANPDAGRQLKVYLDGDLVTTIDVLNTGSYNTLQDYIIHNIPLTGGNGKILRLENVNSDFDFDRIEFIKTNNNTSSEFEAQYNGNIAALEWSTYNNKTTSTSELRRYNFAYDELNRLLSSSYKAGETETGTLNETGLRYDLNGNILSLQRTAPNGTVPKPLDYLNYTYKLNSNQLAKVSDNADKTAGFVDGTNTGDDYAYDANGNLTSDQNKKISSIKYNFLNLPEEITFQDNSKIVYIYDASGNKLRKISTNATGASTTVDYCGELEFTQNTLSLIHTEEGIVTYDQAGTGTYQYFLKDHLGNTRVVIDQAGKVTQMTDYYPFGGTSWTDANSVANKYLYNGKEKQDEFGLDWYDYGARFYDAQIGRWHSVDPASENGHYDYTPYAYVYNNPLIFIDPFGLDSVYVLDQATRPTDNGTVGQTYTATIYVVQNGEISESYEGSSYPNSVSNSDNTTTSNTVNEGTYPYNNESGHTPASTGVTEQGLNIVDSNGDRNVPGTTPSGTGKTMTNVNVHEGESDNGNYNSRGSKGCITIKPADSGAFFGNFDWSGTGGVRGNSTGSIIIQRGATADATKTRLQTQRDWQQNPMSTIEPIRVTTVTR